MRNILFQHFWPLILASKTNQQIMVLKAISWTSFFFSNNGRFWDPLRNPMGSKMALQIDQWAPKGANNLIVQRHFRDPGFHETMVIKVPLGHRGF